MRGWNPHALRTPCGAIPLTLGCDARWPKSLCVLRPNDYQPHLQIPRKQGGQNHNYSAGWFIPESGPMSSAMLGGSGPGGVGMGPTSPVSGSTWEHPDCSIFPGSTWVRPPVALEAGVCYDVRRILKLVFSRRRFSSKFFFLTPLGCSEGR